jgi:hypothetical protein
MMHDRLDEIAYAIYISFFDEYKVDGVFPDDFGVSPGIMDIDSFIYSKKSYYYNLALPKLRKEKLKKLKECQNLK